eukprot:2775492-Pyramimonas_sp.AAC.1
MSSYVNVSICFVTIAKVTSTTMRTPLRRSAEACLSHCIWILWRSPALMTKPSRWRASSDCRALGRATRGAPGGVSAVRLNHRATTTIDPE